MPELPSFYWHEVNHYCEEIMARTHVKILGAGALAAEVQIAGWTALTSEHTVAVLSRSRFAYMKLLKGKMQYSLRLIATPPKNRALGEYRIAFNPIAKKISSVARGERRGLHLPHHDDYTTLLTELQNGVVTYVI